MKKIEITQPPPPLQADAFGALHSLDTSALRPGDEPQVSLKQEKRRAPAQRLILRREKKDRGGKTVVVIAGYVGAPAELEAVARQLRKRLGCGGAVTGMEIVLQGDQPAAVASALQEMGHQVRGVTV
jgi:translation initiation factor 1